MDINALNELIARARETAASVAQAEQRVAACHGRTRRQPEIKAAPVRSIGSFPSGSRGGCRQRTSCPKLPDRQRGSSARTPPHIYERVPASFRPTPA